MEGHYGGMLMSGYTHTQSSTEGRDHVEQHNKPVYDSFGAMPRNFPQLFVKESA